MKKTIAYLFAALAIVTAASCTKDEQFNNDEQSRTRVIELTFDNGDATKVGVSDRTPKWEDGDQIWLSDGTNSETVTLTASDIDKTNNIAKITTTLSGTLYAVYPASAQNGVSGAGEEKQIGFKIPTSTDGTFGKAHISVAKGETSLAFKNVVSILKITTEAATKIVNISSTSKIAGEFKVTYSTLAIAEGTNQADGINVTSSAAGDKYVAVASGIAFNALDFTVVRGATDWASKKSTKSTVTALNSIYDLGSVSTWGLTYSTNGSLWAKFSVSPTTKVRFSKGNLQFKAGNGTSANPEWRFAANQYDYIGNAAGNNTTDATARSTQSAWIDLFGWGATGQNSNGQQPYSISTTSKDYKTVETAGGSETLTIANKADWGFCMGGATSVWYTMSGGGSGEWKYLLSTRTVNGGKGEGKSYRRATINSDATGVYGLIIYPDGYTSQTTAKSYTSSVWTTMEEAGCVFLPAAGDRNGSNVANVGHYGVYWSSTADGSYFAYVLLFSSYGVNLADSYNRDYGVSVRLVCAAQ